MIFPRPPVLRLTGWRLAAAIAVFVALMALGARIDAPMHPVPMSLQSLAVLAAGAILGPVFGTAAVVIYLLLGGLGLPVFAEGASGWGRFIGPTGGYLVAFPVAALLAGLAARRGWMSRPLPAFATGLAGHAVLLGVGTAWLAVSIGIPDAVAGGLTPFVWGAAAKSAVLAALTVIASRRGVT